MLDAVRMKEACRICGRELCGNQRRWIFHPAAKLSLQVLLSHAVGRDLSRDGRGEFACSKCAFLLERMYRFDTVIARVEALSLERLQKLLQEKERLRRGVGGLYRRNNPGEGGGEEAELCALQEAGYSDLIQEDLVFSVYESWAEKEDLDQHLLHCTGADAGHKPRRCRGCAALRVADSDYEAVCKVPRSLGRRSTSCGPSTRCSAAALGVEEVPRSSEGAADPPLGMESHSPASSLESLEIPTNPKDKEEADPEEAPGRRDPLWRKAQTEFSLPGMEALLGLLRGWEYRPVTPPRGSRLPVLVKGRLERSLTPPARSPCGGGVGPWELHPHPAVPEVVVLGPERELQEELEELEEQWLDDYVQCGPFRFQQRLIQEQQGQLSQYESAAGQCVGELQQAQNQVRSLQANIKESEAQNQKLQRRLADMELQLRSAREEAQQQDRSVQNLTDSLRSKEAEVAELCRAMEEQNQTLASLRELAARSQAQQRQLSGTEAAPGQAEVLALQASLFQAQLELQAGQRAQRRAARTQEDQNRALERLERDLQGALQHRREAERHNQELQLALQQAAAALQEQEAQLRASEHDRRRDEEQRERTEAELRTRLQTKERLVQEYSEMMKEPEENRDRLLQKLRQRITERDRALERAVDERFGSAEEKEEEARRLQLLLRQKDVDLERQRCVLANNEETIASLEALLRGKALELEQVSDSWRSAQKQQQDAEERQEQVLRERDAVIDQLQAALLDRTQEAQDLRCSLLPQVHSAPGQVLEELKVRLQLKDRLFQAVMSDRTRLAQEHQDQVQDLLRAVGARDRYIQDSAGRLAEVLTEQTARVQALRRQLSSAHGSQPDPAPELALEAQALREELRLALMREKESQQDRRSQAGRLDRLSRSLDAKDELIRDLHRQMAAPSDLPLVERLTQEVQELREVLVRQGAAESGGRSCQDEDEAEEELRSEFLESVADEESGSQDLQRDGEGLMEVKQLVEHKRVLERELGELKGQLEKAGFSSLSQMRRALLSLRSENQDLKLELAERRTAEEPDTGLEEEEEEEELDVTVEEEEESSEMWEAWDGELTPSEVRIQRMETPPHLLSSSSQDAAPSPAPSPAACEKTERLRLRSRDLQERLMVSEATVQAQAEQLKDYRELLTEAAVQQDSKQIQVDLQDLGYETCGRSENEAEREEASSPEFDDLEMCTSLDCGAQWWPAGSSGSTRADASSLQRLVEDLRSQLTRSQRVIRGLQARLRSPPASADPPKLNWTQPASLSGTEDDEGWQSSDGGAPASQRLQDKELQQLTCRVDALEDQLRTGDTKKDEGRSASWPGKFDSLIRAQARELSLLRQRLREGGAVCRLLSQHLGDSTKAFEELLRANDVDYYMGQSFREQLAQSGALAQRVSASIGGRDQAEDPEEKTELLAIRLSKELQQKDKIIESLRAKLNQHAYHHRPDTPSSSHALSDISDQSDRISYVSDEHGSTNDDLELCSEADAASELGPEDAGNAARIGTGFSSPQSKSLHGFPLAHRHPADPSGSLPFSYQAFQPSPFSSSLDAGVAVKAGASLLDRSALWEMPFGRAGADLSSGSSGYQSGTSHTGSDLMKEHLREIRSLRQRLEDSIQTNDRLRQQLEEKLARGAMEKGAPTNIYIQGLDSVSQLSSEVRLLKEENISLQTQLKLANRDGSREAEHLREVVLVERCRLKEAELETQRWAELSKRLQAEDGVRCQEVAQLKQDRQRSQEATNRLQHEASVLQQQLDESRRLIQTLQNELQEANGRNTRSAALQSGAPDGSPSSRPHRPPLGHSQGFKALQQQLLDGTSLVIQMEAALCSLNASQRLRQPSDPGCVRNLLSDTKSLKQVLQEAESLLQVLWRADLSDAEEKAQGGSLREEVVSLRLKLSEREQALKDTMETLRSSNLTKDSMEYFIVSQLSRTRDVLKKAKTNLQENKLRISSLHQASAPPPPPLPPSSSSPLSHPRSVKGENPGGSGELASAAGCRVLTASCPAAWTPAPQRRPLQAVWL
ncbi:myomegalin isoform X6 [Fundulus heteroclitus]|uniref:myomegalin isoform X6 n=1 Tax=Fundulus heteroclitus TaxID=8078 RepID=UPI00165A256C|nr:myomegalin isoform X6 [Fundulus heteroclitus]